MPENIELLKLKLEERRLDEEIQIKKKELELREKELEFQLKQSEESQKARGFSAQIFSPVGVAVVVALFGLFGTTASLWNTSQIEDKKRQAELFIKWYERNDGKDEKQGIIELLNFKEFGYLTIPLATEIALRQKIGLNEKDPIPPPSSAPIPQTVEQEKIFFDRYDKEFGSISEETKNNLKEIFKAIKDEKEIKDVNLVAYALATIKVETADAFKPVTESGSDKYIEEKYGFNTPFGKGLGNTEEGDAAKYKGRGYILLTGKNNYKIHNEALKLAGTENDLINYPEKALEPRLAFRIYLYGIRNGTFSGRKIDEFINKDKSDYVNARKVINGTDKAAVIAEIAKKFESILRENLADKQTKP